MVATQTRTRAPETRNDGPVAAADTVPAATGTGRPNGAADAVWGALTANPGATVTVIAEAARVSRSSAARTLTTLEKDGRAVRTAGIRIGGKRAPDTWAADVTEAPASVGDETPFDDTSNEATSAEASADAPDAAPDATVTEPDSATTDSADGTPDAVTPDDGDLGAAQHDEPSPASESDAEGDTAGADAPDPADEEIHDALAGFLNLVSATFDAHTNGDSEAVMTSLETIYSDAAKVRRIVKAAMARKTRAASGTGDRARPGQLREQVRDHIAEHPGAELTPYEIGRAIGRSAGAVANALDRLVSLGEAELTCERPRRYRATADAAANATP
jgi:hypothetical protein